MIYVIFDDVIAESVHFIVAAVSMETRDPNGFRFSGDHGDGGGFWPVKAKVVECGPHL